MSNGMEHDELICQAWRVVHTCAKSREFAQPSSPSASCVSPPSFLVPLSAAQGAANVGKSAFVSSLLGACGPHLHTAVSQSQ